jgi:hypothetical protein
MTKAKLNKKQRSWRNKFISEHHYASVRAIRADLSGSRILTIDWQESIDIPKLQGCTDQGRGWIQHQLTVKLRVFGDARYTADHKAKVVYPHCHLNYRGIVLDGQLSLPISQLTEFPLPQNPVVVKHKKRQPRKPKPISIQHRLPLDGIEARLLSIHLNKGHQLQSSQTLMAEKVSYWSLEQRRQINLPQAIIDLLTDAKSSHEEWENALLLYQVAGPSAVLAFIEGLPIFRIRNKTTVSTVAESLSLQPLVKKVTTTSVKQTNP